VLLDGTQQTLLYIGQQPALFIGQYYKQFAGRVGACGAYASDGASAGRGESEVDRPAVGS